MKDQEPVKILYITQEINPYIKETEIADICRQFPQFTIEKGCEIRTFMPCFGHINERRNQLHEVQRLSGLNVIIDDNDHPLIIKVATIQKNGLSTNVGCCNIFVGNLHIEIQILTSFLETIS